MANYRVRNVSGTPVFSRERIIHLPRLGRIMTPRTSLVLNVDLLTSVYTGLRGPMEEGSVTVSRIDPTKDVPISLPDLADLANVKHAAPKPESKPALVVTEEKVEPAPSLDIPKEVTDATPEVEPQVETPISEDTNTDSSNDSSTQSEETAPVDGSEETDSGSEDGSDVELSTEEGGKTGVETTQDTSSVVKPRKRSRKLGIKKAKKEE